MKLHSVKLKKNLLIDAFLASVIVQQSPKVINQYLLSSSPISGTMLEVVGGGVAYLVGMLFGKEDIANIGLALAGADVANEFISSWLNQSGSNALPSTQTGAIKDYSNSPVLRLREYTNSVASVDYNSYRTIYN